jgi:hypothetical protein
MQWLVRQSQEVVDRRTGGYGSTQRFYNQRFYKKTMTSPTNK